MGLKTRRTDHAGKLRGSDGQKEYDNKTLLKWDSARRRRRNAKREIEAQLAENEEQGILCHE